MKLSSVLDSRKFGIDIVIILLVGLFTGLSLVKAGKMEFKWTVFIISAVTCMAVVFIIPERESFFLYFFFFALMVGLDFYPIHIQPLVFRPLSGFVIHFYDIPLFFLTIFWITRLILNPAEKIHFFPWISIPFLLVWTLCIAGVNR